MVWGDFGDGKGMYLHRVKGTVQSPGLNLFGCPMGDPIFFAVVYILHVR